MEYTSTASSDPGAALAGAQAATKIMTQDAIAARVRRFAMQDRLFLLVTFAFAAIVLIVLLGILISLVVEAWPALGEFGFGFLVGTRWSPTDDVYGAVIGVYGTLVTSAIAPGPAHRFLHRAGRDPIGVIVAIDGDGLSAENCGCQALGRSIHVAEDRRIGQECAQRRSTVAGKIFDRHAAGAQQLGDQVCIGVP